VDYLARSAFLCFGATLFCARLLLSRCIVHWIPDQVKEAAKALNQIRKRLVKQYLDTDAASMDFKRFVKILPGEGGGCVGPDGLLIDADNRFSHEALTSGKSRNGGSLSDMMKQTAPSDSSLDEFISVLADPQRLEVLCEVAEKSFVTENVDFLCTVLNFERVAADSLAASTVPASCAIKEHASSIFTTFITANSAKEVNVSSSTRSKVERALLGWSAAEPLVSRQEAEAFLLNRDAARRVKLFDPAVREISTMLYQNIWNKFLNAEAQKVAAGGYDDHEHDHNHGLNHAVVLDARSPSA
jgi:hypothetical protein